MTPRVIADTGKARQHWERRSDPLPYLMVPMSDGTVIRYNPEIKQPGFQKAIWVSGPSEGSACLVPGTRPWELEAIFICVY